MIRNRKLLRAIAVFLLVQFVGQTFAPTVSYALTSGPTQPEFSSFEPVSSSNMVDEFSGDFTYNLPVIEIPGPHGSSYPLSLSYHSGVTSEEESSWVGLGWTLNPGAINRNTRGVPDDFNGQETKFHNKMPKNWTVTAGFGHGFEFRSKDARLGYNVALRYNNYRGFGYNAGFGLTLGRGVVNLGYGVSDGTGSFSLNISPAAALNNYLKESDKEIKYKTAKFDECGDRISQPMAVTSGQINVIGSRYGIFSFNEFPKPSTMQHYTGKSFNVSVSSQLNATTVPIGVTFNINGSYSYQENVPMESVKTFGYLYSSEGQSDVTSIMDYHIEKETPVNKRNVFLGIPFNDADNFSVTGEGIGGGFRFYNKKGGHFSPRKMQSEIKIVQAGVEFDYGVTNGFGVDVGKGKQKFKQGRWMQSNISDFAKRIDQTNQQDEPAFLRFNNDLGGEWGYNHNDKPVQASILPILLEPVVNPALFSNNENERSGRSSYIDYNLNKEMILAGTPDPTFRAYNKSKSNNFLVDRTTANVQNLVGEIAITNEGGMRYVYGVPVYSKNEKSLSHGVAKAGTKVKKRYMVYDHLDNAIQVGQDQADPYATTYLLSEITTPDYIDRWSTGTKPDGPTAEDLGGYTRFNYEKATLDTDYFNWRAPYSGLLYNKNSHSDPKDDLGSYSSGEKEIYYVQSIETKTHVAIFTLEERFDGQEAPSDAESLHENPLPGTRKLKSLKQIDLYSIDDCKPDPASPNIRKMIKKDVTVKPIKTVVFKYDYSLCQNTPNSAGPAKGKLTLTRVHFEYNGTNPIKISPYEFVYRYPNAAEFAKYPAKYTSGVDNVTAGYTGTLNENPGYDVFSADPWGNFQANGQSRFDDMRAWVNQNPATTPADFDPAPWHLKIIRLPSGGEMHVQYEQDDYNYVQDQEAHVMVNLKSGSSSNKLYLDLANIGVTSVAEIKAMIKKRYEGTDKKMYFKFLYKLINPPGSSTDPDLEMCNAEFITGYVTVKYCDDDASGLFIELDPLQRLPMDVCKEFVKTQRLGMIDPDGNCVPGFNEGSGSGKKKAISVVNQLFGMITTTFGVSTLCQRINPAHSYLRVPTPNPKKGGGVRVKRMLMFDNGVENETVLFGTEYNYKTVENGRIISSGVATNEPGTIREENILVDYIARKKQSLFSRIIAGRDLQQSEGPIGESILPGASVGYSKVTVRNIHSGKTQPGFSISEFYTSKDFPIVLGDPSNPATMTSINSTSPINKQIPGVVISIVRDKTWATQGFSFIVNNMHGQVKSKATYAGPYSDILDLKKSTLVSGASYEFYKPGEKVPVVNKLFGEVTLKSPGREVDMTLSQKKIEEKSYDANIEGDIELASVPPIIMFYPTALPSLALTQGGLYTHATTKVVRYPAIMKKTTHYQDGIVHVEEVLALDENTGKPAVVKSTDEFKGAYLAQSVPASWEYPNYTPKAITENKRLTSDFTYTAATNELKFTGGGCGMLSQIVTGDMLELAPEVMFQVESIDYSQDIVKLLPVASYPGTVPATLTSVTIVRSGRNNKLSEAAGSITMHSQDATTLNANTVRQPDSQRFVEDGGKDVNGNPIGVGDDGTLFILHLNQAYKAYFGQYVNNPSSSVDTQLAGPYEHMDLRQYVDKLPEGCGADLADANVKDVRIRFRAIGDNMTVELGTFWVKCGTQYRLVENDNE